MSSVPRLKPEMAQIVINFVWEWISDLFFVRTNNSVSTTIKLVDKFSLIGKYFQINYMFNLNGQREMWPLLYLIMTSFNEPDCTSYSTNLYSVIYAFTSAPIYQYFLLNWNLGLFFFLSPSRHKPLLRTLVFVRKPWTHLFSITAL
jgi:hypothetical protein